MYREGSAGLVGTLLGKKVIVGASRQHDQGGSTGDALPCGKLLREWKGQRYVPHLSASLTLTVVNKPQVCGDKPKVQGKWAKKSPAEVCSTQ